MTDPHQGGALPRGVTDDHRLVLAALVANHWARGCSALEVAYLVNQGSSPAEVDEDEVTVRLVDLLRWGLADVVDPDPDWPDASRRFRANEAGRAALA
jgi:hypothetical protein